jgi:hypothetical protein
MEEENNKVDENKKYEDKEDVNEVHIFLHLLPYIYHSIPIFHNLV